MKHTFVLIEHYWCSEDLCYKEDPIAYYDTYEKAYSRLKKSKFTSIHSTYSIQQRFMFV